MEVFNYVAGVLVVGLIIWLLKVYKDGVTTIDLHEVKTVIHKRIDNMEKEINSFNISLSGVEKDVVNNKKLHDQTLTNIEKEMSEIKANTKFIIEKLIP